MIRSRRRFVLALVCAGSFAVGGCSSSTAPEPTAVIARIVDENIFAGGSSEVHLVNTTAADWSASACPIKLERLGSAGWETVAVPECTEDAVSLTGGEPHVAQLRVPPGSEFGVHRAVYNAWSYVPGESFAPFKPVQVRSNQFYVPAIR
jgi:hypothetical protein